MASSLQRATYIAGLGVFGASLAGGLWYCLGVRREFPRAQPPVLLGYRESLARGELHRAAREYRTATLIDPTSVGFPSELVLAMRQASDSEGEIDLYRQARERWPRDPAVHVGLARAYCRWGRPSEGVKSFDAALALVAPQGRDHDAISQARTGCLGGGTP